MTHLAPQSSPAFYACLTSIATAVAAAMRPAPQRLRHYVLYYPLLGWMVWDGREARQPVRCAAQLPTVMAAFRASGWEVTELHPVWWRRLLGQRRGWRVELPHWDAVKV